MKTMQILILALSGGGALWLGLNNSDAMRPQCKYCGSDGRCHTGTDMTCTGGYNPPDRPWCVSSSGCVFTT